MPRTVHRVHARRDLVNPWAAVDRQRALAFWRVLHPAPGGDLRQVADVVAVVVSQQDAGEGIPREVRILAGVPRAGPSVNEEEVLAREHGCARTGARGVEHWTAGADENDMQLAVIDPVLVAISVDRQVRRRHAADGGLHPTRSEPGPSSIPAPVDGRWRHRANTHATLAQVAGGGGRSGAGPSLLPSTLDVVGQQRFEQARRRVAGQPLQILRTPVHGCLAVHAWLMTIFSQAPDLYIDYTLNKWKTQSDGT